MRVPTVVFRIACFLFIQLVLISWAATVRAEVCTGDNPTWLGGRVVVHEMNYDPPALRGVGEVFVYAYQRGDTPEGIRRMAVTDNDGYFCIHDTDEGEWLVTSYEPFTFRPFVIEMACTPGNCDLGDIHVDRSMARISDDFVDYEDGWWGGPFAQTVEMPADAQALVKISVRSAAGSVNDLQVYEGEGTGGALVGDSSLQIPDNAGGGRGTAVFPPGLAGVQGEELYTVVLGGGSAVWRLSGDAYGDGQMFSISGNDLFPIAGQDMCLTIGVDGPNGLHTSFYAPNNDGYIYGSTIAQSFVARSPYITHAHFFVGTPCDLCRIQASISDTVDGPPIGPVKETQGVHEQGVAFGWFGGEVPVTVGQAYYVRYHFPEGWSVAYTLSQGPVGGDVYAQGEAFSDGNPQGVDLWGRVMGGDDGGDDDDAADDDDAGDDDDVGDDDDTGDDDAADDDDLPGDDDTGGGGEGGCSCAASGTDYAFWVCLALLLPSLKAIQRRR